MDKRIVSRFARNVADVRHSLRISFEGAPPPAEVRGLKRLCYAENGDIYELIGLLYYFS